MKKIDLSIKIALFAAIIMTSGAIYAQKSDGTGYGQRGKGECKAINMLPNLTEEQTTQIEALKTKHMDAMLDYRARLNVLQAELRELEVADKADINKINGKIDEITAVKNKMAKEKSAHHQAVRNLLTPEQRIAFDSHYGYGRGFGNKPHQFNGNRACTGNGPGKGYAKKGGN